MFAGGWGWGEMFITKGHKETFRRDGSALCINCGSVSAAVCIYIFLNNKTAH